MKKGIKNKINLINDVSGLKYDKNNSSFKKIQIFHLLFIICKEHQKICKKILHIKMFF